MERKREEDERMFSYNVQFFKLHTTIIEQMFNMSRVVTEVRAGGNSGRQKWEEKKLS
jgi:hypothetical protein